MLCNDRILHTIQYNTIQTRYYATCPPPGLWLAFAREPILEEKINSSIVSETSSRQFFPTWTGCSRGSGRERCPRRSGSLELLWFLVNIWHAPSTLSLITSAEKKIYTITNFFRIVLLKRGFGILNIFILQ